MEKPANRNEGAPVLLSNAEIADRLERLAQLMSTQKENPYKVKAYLRAAARMRNLPDSLEEMVGRGDELTHFEGVGAAIASAIREIVTTGTLAKLEKLRGQVTPAVAELNAHPRLDPKRVMRVYKKLNISTVGELRQRLESGEIENAFGSRMSKHIRQGLTQTHAMLLYRADDLRELLEEFLLEVCRVRRAEVAGDYRRRVEVMEEIVFVIETDNFAMVLDHVGRYGGRTSLIDSGVDHASFALSSGILLRLQVARKGNWGTKMVIYTGSKAHLKKLAAANGPLHGLEFKAFASEKSLYEHFGLQSIEPELREGHDEVQQAKSDTLPALVTAMDVRGELHAHSLASDGVDSIEDMAAAARERGYEYIGITDHSQSLKIAGGLSIEDLWAQIRYIDKLNGKLRGVRILKSSEVDILADGSLDYPDDLLRELDYTMCSIHSRFGLDKTGQTRRLLRAMDNRYFNILGHATGRLLLKRPGYEIDVERVVEQAKQNGCYFEINSSPDRLDLSAQNARLAGLAGVMIAITTDAHSTGELDLVRCGLDQARRAGLQKSQVLNCLPLAKLLRIFRR